MKKNKDLEETIREKVSPLLEDTMEKSLGITIPKLGNDITDQLMDSRLNIYVPLNLGFQTAKKAFKSKFLAKELQLHLGNISDVAKSLGLDRRSIHRVIKELDIDVNKVRGELESKEEFQEHLIDKTIRSTLENYADIIQPHKMEKMYEQIPNLSRNIAKFIPHQDITWKEAEKEFEKQFLYHALDENNWNIAKSAEKIGIRSETLHRKIKKLELRK
jgi:transcriptional regulator of acetoin/glycerol metabolism